MTATTPPSGLSLSTHRKASSFPSCTCRSPGTAGSQAALHRCLCTKTGDGSVISAAQLAPAMPTGDSGTDEKRPAKTCGSLYVALTRAMCRVIVWWAPTYNTGSAPLHRLLLGRAPGELHPHGKPAIPADTALASAFQAWAATRRRTYLRRGGPAPRQQPAGGMDAAR